MSQDRVHVVRNCLTGRLLTHGSGRTAVFWNPKKAAAAANRAAKVKYKDPDTFTWFTCDYEVLELDPSFGFVVYSTQEA